MLMTGSGGAILDVGLVTDDDVQTGNDYSSGRRLGVDGRRDAASRLSHATTTSRSVSDFANCADEEVAEGFLPDQYGWTFSELGDNCTKTCENHGGQAAEVFPYVVSQWCYMDLAGVGCDSWVAQDIAYEIYFRVQSTQSVCKGPSLTSTNLQSNLADYSAGRAVQGAQRLCKCIYE